MDQIRIGDFIAECRREKGYTQQQLADRMNLSNKTISKWESGAGCPDLSNLGTLAAELGVTSDEILNGHKLIRVNQENTNTDPGVYDEKRSLTVRQKWEITICVLAAGVGAILGILAYNHGWLG